MQPVATLPESLMVSQVAGDDAELEERSTIYPHAVLIGLPVIVSLEEFTHYVETRGLAHLVICVLAGAWAVLFTVLAVISWLDGDSEEDEEENFGGPYIAFERAHLRLLGDTAIPWTSITSVRTTDRVMLEPAGYALPTGTFLVLGFATAANRDAAAGRHLALLTHYNWKLVDRLTTQSGTASVSRILGIEIDSTYNRRASAHLDMDSTHIGEWTRRYWEAARAQQPPPATRPIPP